LVVRCMQRELDQRPPSALAVRQALELFLEHRGATALAREAEDRLDELESLLAAKDVEVEQAYNVFGACRFGFKQALRAWSDSPAATSGLRRAIVLMVRFEAEQGDARAASLLAAELPARDPEIDALVDAARKRAEEAAKRIEKLRELEKDLDPREGRTLRLAAGVVFGLLWAIVPLLARFWLRAQPEYEGLFTIPVCVVSLLILGVAFRHWRDQPRINRQLFAAFTFAIAAQPLAVLVLHFVVHLDGTETFMFLMAYWSMIMGLMAASIERRLFPLPLAYAAGFFGVLELPDWRYATVAATNLVAVVTVAVIWSRRGTERAIEREKLREERGTIC
jgi:hypothetical protein